MSKFPERVFSGIQPTGDCTSATISARSVNLVRLQETHDCLYCVVDLHAMTICQDPKDLTRATRARSPPPTSPRASIRSAHRLQPEPGAGACRARLDLQLRGAPRLAEPHDAVQGEGRQGPRERLGRALRLSGADGRRHPRLHGDARAGRRGPEAAPGADAATSRRSSTTTSPNRSPRTVTGMPSSRCPSR